MYIFSKMVLYMFLLSVIATMLLFQGVLENYFLYAYARDKLEELKKKTDYVVGSSSVEVRTVTPIPPSLSVGPITRHYTLKIRVLEDNLVSFGMVAGDKGIAYISAAVPPDYEVKVCGEVCSNEGEADPAKPSLREDRIIITKGISCSGGCHPVICFIICGGSVEVCEAKWRRECGLGVS